MTSANNVKMSYSDIGSYFYLGSIETMWIVVAVTNDGNCLCMMDKTDDCAIFSQDMIFPLLNEFHEYWDGYN